jgi:hypothetical protein
VVHHLLYNRIGPRFERTFIADSAACIAGRGTTYAAERLERKIRSITENWQRPGALPEVRRLQLLPVDRQAHRRAAARRRR